MRLVIRQRYPNHRVLWVDHERQLAACRNTVYRMDAVGRREAVASYHPGLPKELLSHFRPIRHLLRLGFHNLCPVAGGGWVAVVKRTLLKSNADSRTFRTVGHLRKGNKPGFKGLCVDDCGRVYYGEYCLNFHRREPIGVFRSGDCGETYALMHEFPPGDVRHIHLIQWDPYSACLWLGTGDADEECRLYRSRDYGRTWILVGGGSQKWRAVGLCFTPNAVYWGTDAGSDTGLTTNHLMRLDRQTTQPERLIEIQGPCHAITSLADGTLLAATGVERGVNEKDDRAHLWASRNGLDWEELMAWRKDLWHPWLQFGVVHFPHGLESRRDVHLTTLGVRGGAETYLIATIED